MNKQKIRVFYYELNTRTIKIRPDHDDLENSLYFSSKHPYYSIIYR